MENTPGQSSRELAHLDTHTWFRLGKYEQAFRSGLHALEDAQAGSRIWGRDGTLWTQEPQATSGPAPSDVEGIENRLGWLELPTTMPVEVTRLKALATEVQAAGTERVVLLGMGGSSLAPEVMRHVLGVSPGYPDLLVLDTTDPTQIRRVTQSSPLLSHTLFIVASKSGTTIEMQSLFAHFRDALINEVGVEHWAGHFCAITDQGTPLEALARTEGFQALYLNPTDIGGRFSALSLFGLVPAALMGVDLDKLLHRAKAMAWQCRVMATPADNPGMVLGAIMGELARHPSPRDKLTLLTSPELSAFGAWAEQLVAESTGKQNRGILPVEGEGPIQIADYGPDRLFVYLRLEGAENTPNDARVAALAEAGHPVVVLPLADPYDLGAEFFRWEFATAVAGQRLGVNPFDQHNVESAKVQARTALDHYRECLSLPEEPALLRDGALSVYGRDLGVSSLIDHVRAFSGQAKEGDYVAIMAYVARNAANHDLLQSMRRSLGDALHLVVTVGFGPRFLHSTGQLHKGGPNTGLFLQITQDESDDLPIPGQPYSFGVLKRAQALGDLQALRQVGRRVLRVNIGPDVQGGLRALGRVVEQALR